MSEKDMTLESTCREGDMPEYIAYFQSAKMEDCSDKDKYTPTVFFPEGCHKTNDNSVKHEVSEDKTKFTVTHFPESTDCTDDENKNPLVENCGECTTVPTMVGAYECGKYIDNDDNNGGSTESKSGAMGVAAFLALVLALLL